MCDITLNYHFDNQPLDLINWLLHCSLSSSILPQDMWIGLLHHVTGEHEWALDSCQHGPLVDERDKDWIQKGSVAHEALKEIILNERWLHQVPKYLHFR